MIAASATSLEYQELSETGLPQTRQWRDGFDIADMDGDGHLDLVHGSARKGPFVPSIFRGDGTGKFLLWREAHYPPLPYDYGDAKAGDLNGDGKTDLALGSHLRGLTVLIQEGDGFFVPWAEGLQLRLPGEFPGEATFSSRAIALADWNKDGRLDLLALNEGPARFATAPAPREALAVFLNRDGVWQRAEAPFRLSFFGTDLAAGDIDADGRPDVVLASHLTGVRRLVQLNTVRGWLPRDLRSLPSRAITTAVALAGVDGRRGDEILAATFTVDGARLCSALDLISVERASDQATLLWSAEDRNAPTAIATGDIDRDGDRDVVALRADGAVMVFTGVDGTLRRDAVIAAPDRYSGCDGYDLHLADLDGDGRPEVIASYAGEGTLPSGKPQCASGGGFAIWRLTVP